ncbi:MAG: hypothetical protein LBH13_01440 [Cellulomonadaceae bacterium]|jgi:hypothetical protein|nr:hypothetical protein [Cellulomonadaceae bacterium]
MPTTTSYTPLIAESPFCDLPDEEVIGAASSLTMRGARLGAKARASIIVLLSLGMVAFSGPAFAGDEEAASESEVFVVHDADITESAPVGMEDDPDDDEEGAPSGAEAPSEDAGEDSDRAPVKPDGEGENGTLEASDSDITHSDDVESDEDTVVQGESEVVGAPAPMTAAPNPFNAPQVDPLTADVLAVSAGTVTIHGTARMGETLTAITEGFPHSDLNFQWFRNGSSMGIATIQRTRQINADDVGHRISVQVSPSIWGDPFTPVMSAEVTVVAGTIDTQPVTITGTSRVGNTLTAPHTEWTTARGTRVHLSYNWLRNGNAISGATGNSFTLAPEDSGQRISVRVTGTAHGFATATRTSDQRVIQAGTITTTAVRITGTHRVGHILTAQHQARFGWNTDLQWTNSSRRLSGDWWAEDGGNLTIRTQWLRNGNAIAGASGNTYRLTAADRGQRISLRVTTSRSGHTTNTRNSGVATIQAGRIQNPRVTMTGTRRVGQVLSAPGRWNWQTENWENTTVRYQWLRNGRAIRGATGQTYRLRNADRGRRISVRVTATRNGYTTVRRTSGAAVVRAGQITGGTVTFNSTTARGNIPTTFGRWASVEVGNTLRANPSNFRSAPNNRHSFRFQWLRNGRPIRGATGRSYRVRRADAGNRISVRVTARRAGYNNRTVTSGFFDAWCAAGFSC